MGHISHQSMVMRVCNAPTIEGQFGRAGVFATRDGVFSDVASNALVYREALRDTVGHYLVFIIIHRYLRSILEPCDLGSGH